MAETLQLDLTPTITGLNDTAEAARKLNAEFAASAEVGKKSYQAAALAATEASNRIAAQVAEVRTAQAVYAELNGVLAEQRQRERDLNSERKNAKGSQELERITAELKANQREQAKVRAEIQLTRQAIQEERTAAAAVKETIRQQTNEQKIAAAAAKDAAVAQREAAQEARKKAIEDKKAADAADKAARAAGLLAQYEKQLVDLTEKRARATTRAEAQGYTKQIKDTKAQIADLKGEADKGGSAIGSMFGRFAGAAGAAAAVGIVVSFVKDLAAQTIEAGKQADATLGKLKFARGNDVEKAAADMAQLAYEADRLGLDINSAGASYGGFTAAATAANLPLAEARRLYLAVAGAGATLKISSDDVEGSLRALQQMVSKGTVSAEELRGQLGERLPGAFSIAAKAIGVTEQQLGDMLKRGEIVATEFLPKFARELERTFGDGSAAAADALQANTNRIDNEWQRFLLRFVSATGGAVSSIAKFSKEANDFLDGLTAEGRIRLGAQRAAAELKGFDRIFAAQAKQAEADAKAAGKSQQEQREAGDKALADEEKQLRAQLALAEKRQKASLQGIGALGANTYQKDEQTNAAKQVALTKGQLQAIEDVRAAREKAAKDEGANLQGLIEKQQLLIKQLRERQESARNENAGDGSDFLFGKGGLNKQLEEAQKELDRLLGKVDKTRKKHGPDYVKQLLVAEEALRKEYNQKELELVRDQGQARAAEQYRQEQDKINRTEANLRKLEKLAGRDGQIDGVQRDQLNALRLGATDTYYKELRRIAQEHADKLFSLEADSDRKEVEAIERKYEKEVEAARGQNDILVKLEEAKQRELLAVRQKQQQQQIERRATLKSDIATANIGQVFGEGTGVSVIEAKRREKEELLKIDLEKNEALLNNSLLLAGEQGEIVRAALRKQIGELKGAIKEVETEKKQHSTEDFFYKLILGEQDSDENRQRLEESFGQIVSGLNQVVAANQQAADLALQARERDINDLSTKLQAQVALRKDGAASNIQATLDELEAAKKARSEALRDQRKAAREQQIINGASQIASIASASAKVLDGWATVPFVGSLLGIAAIGAMITGFVVAQTRAKKQVEQNSTGSFFTGGEGYTRGGYTGAGNPREESRALGPRDYTYHKREFIFNHEKTDKHLTLFRALHSDSLQNLTWADPSLQELRLKVRPDPTLPQQLRESKEQLLRVQHEHTFGSLRQEFEAQKQELSAIKDHVARLPKKSYHTDELGRLVEIDLLSGSKTTYVAQ